MSILKKILRKIFPSQQSRRVKPWMKINGDKTLRLDYDLREQSLVFDLGGYEGQWASDIFSKYLCTVFVFEPFPEYAKNIQKRFSSNRNIKVFSFGLGKKDDHMFIYNDADATSVFKKKGTPCSIEIRNVSSFIRENQITSVDLMKINIEGGEYDLLEAMIESGIVKMVKNIQVQFHDFVPDASIKMKKIQNMLSATHKPSYQFEYVWENWVLKD